MSGVDVITVTETGVKPEEPVPSLPGFACIAHAPRPNMPNCGGVACFVRSDLQGHAAHVKSYPHDGISLVTLRVPGHRKVLFVVCYLPCYTSAILGVGQQTRRAAAQAWFEHLHDVVTDHVDCDVIITGDLNARTGSLSEVDHLKLEAWGDVPVPDPLLQYHRTMLSVPARRNCDGYVRGW